MHTCLSCGAEYDDAAGVVRRCADCGSRTLSDDELRVWEDIRDDLAHETFVAVRVLDGPADRAMLSAILEDEGVPFVVHGGDAFGNALSGGGGVLLVAEDAEQKARGLLAQYDAAVVPDEFASQ